MKCKYLEQERASYPPYCEYKGECETKFNYAGKDYCRKELSRLEDEDIFNSQRTKPNFSFFGGDKPLQNDYETESIEGLKTSDNFMIIKKGRVEE